MTLYQFFLFLAFFGILLFIWIFGIYHIVCITFPLIDTWNYIFTILLSGIGLCFFLGILLGNMTSRRWIREVYRIGAIGMWAITIYGILGILFFVFGNITHTVYTDVFSVTLFFGIGIILNLYWLYKWYNPIIKNYTLSINKNHTWHGKKIVLISDTHYGNIYGKKHAKKLVEKINSVGSDIVLIPGDFFDGPMTDYAGVADVFRWITAPHGVLFSSGNHEEYNHTHEILMSIERAGMKILNGKKIEIDGMVFAGVPYHETETIDGLKNSLDRVDLENTKPIILLKHKPTHISTVEKYGIDLVVSWHVHRGQMFPFSLIPYLVFWKYAYGKYRKNGLTSITTSGVWTWWAPQRIWTSAEIVVITIE